MAEREKCQAELAAGLIAGEGYTHICGTEVRNWRACGLGCGTVFAFCEPHGGDARATDACVAHHTVCPKRAEPPR